MGATAAGSITITVPARRSGGFWRGAWAARAHTGPAAAAFVGSAWLAASTSLDHRQTLGLAAGAAATSSVAVARRRRSAHADRMRAYRLSRGRLDDVYPLDEPLPSIEGRFRLGVQSDPGPRGDYELVWDPWGGDAPNFMAAGSTGAGKTELVRLLATYALGWGWDVEVIDLKASTEYDPLPVYDTTAAARDCLARVMADLRRRGALLRDVEREIVDPLDGTTYTGHHRNFRDVPAELRRGFRSRLVIVDEAALLALGSSQDEAARKAGQNAIAFLQAATALVRSLGVHVVLAVQRPDADLLPGFTKNNLQARALLGRNDDEAQRMTLTNAVASEAVELSDVTERPPGRLVAVGIGTPAAVLGQAYLMHESALHRAAAAAGLTSQAATAARAGGPTVTGSGDDLAPSPARSSGEGADNGYLPASLRSGVGTFGPPPTALAGSAPSSPPSPSSRSGSTLARLRAPVARGALRVTAWRLLVSPARAAPSPRPSGLRDATLARRGHRCAACGDTAGPFDVEHFRPRWAGGSDRPRNLWVACRRCHAAKTAEEVIVRRWRARLHPRASARAIARVPVWTWPLAASLVLGVAIFGGLLGFAVAAGLAWQGSLVMFRRSGLDGLPTADARLEGFFGGPIGAAARWRTATFATAGATRLYAGGLGYAWIVGLVLRWWW